MDIKRILKEILSFIGVVGKATPEQTEASLRKLRAALGQQSEQTGDCQVVFAYGMKS